MILPTQVLPFYVAERQMLASLDSLLDQVSQARALAAALFLLFSRSSVTMAIDTKVYSESRLVFISIYKMLSGNHIFRNAVFSLDSQCVSARLCYA